MARVSTHVLDTSRGRPAVDVRVVLEDADGGVLDVGTTDQDGRVADIGPDRMLAGVYRLRFDSASYFRGQNVACFYPEVVIVFDVGDPEQHYHVPLLLTAFGYSTYRGS